MAPDTEHSLYQPQTGPRIVHIPTSPGCNNRCEFCMDQAKGPGPFTLDQHIAQLSQGRELADAVTFTSGEPTLTNHLPQAVAAARDLDYRVIGIVTNGRRLCQRDFLLSLLDAGMNEFTVSAHGPTADIHDAITGRRGSFEQTRRGLRNLAELREPDRFCFRMNCTVVVKNLPYIREMYSYAMGFGVDILNFNVVEARGAALRDLHGTVPRYVDVVQTMQATGLDFNSPTVSMSRVPPCCGGQSWAQEEFLLMQDDRINRYIPQDGKVKGPPCAACTLDPSCPGIWAGYAQGYGWDECTPLSAPHDGLLRVTLGAPCLNHCAHCPGSKDAPLRAQLTHGWLAGHRRVLLAGGDPLLDKHLPQHLDLCRSMGFTQVAVETNGQVLCQPAFAEAVVRLGIDEIVVRVFGAKPAQADTLTRTPGSFRRALAGMVALQRRGQAWRVDVQVPGVEAAESREIEATVLSLVQHRATRDETRRA